MEQQTRPVAHVAKQPEKHPKKRTRKTKAIRRQEIADATVRVIAKYGVPGATVSRISSAAGLSKGALYCHFRNREEVLEAAVELLAERAAGWVGQPVGSDVMRHLIELGESHSSWASRELDSFVRPIHQLIASRADPEATELVGQWLQRDFRTLVAQVEQGKRQGSIRTDLESEDVAWSVLAIAWAEDVARLMGAERFISGGASGRILKRLLATYAQLPSLSPGNEYSSRS